MLKTKIIYIPVITAMLFSLVFASQNTLLAHNEDESETNDSSYDCDLVEDDKKRRECEDNNKKIKAYRQIINLKQKQGATLNNQISIMDAEIGHVETEINIKEKKIEEFGDQIEDLKNKIKEKEELIVVQRKVLSELIRAYYEYNRQNVLNTLIKDSGLPQFMSEEDRIVQVGDGVREMLSSILALKADMENEKKSSEDKKTKTTDLKNELKEKNVESEDIKLQKQVLLIETQGDEARYQTRLEKVKRQQLAIQREIEEIEFGKIGNIDFEKLPKAQSGYLSYPVKNAFVTQRYGKATWTKWYDFHNGIDLRINYRSIYPAKSGRVLATGNNGNYAYGKWIAIDHGDGLVTLYGHLSQILVSKGDKIKRKKKIAISGNSGYSTGPHVHFSVFAKNTFEISKSKHISGLRIPKGGSINPNRYLP